MAKRPPLKIRLIEQSVEVLGLDTDVFRVLALVIDKCQKWSMTSEKTRAVLSYSAEQRTLL